MKANLSLALRTLLMLMVFASPILADTKGKDNDEGKDKDKRGDVFPTPELDPGSMASAVTLLVGGALMLKDRRRQK